MPDRFVFKNLVSHLAETAKRSPNQTAIFSASNDNVTKRNFKELNEDVSQCATYLQAKGLIKGQKALLFVKPGYELTVLAFSAIYLGVIPVIIDPGMGFRSVLSCIRSTKPDILIGVPLVVWMSFFLKIHSRQSIRRFELVKISFTNIFSQQHPGTIARKQVRRKRSLPRLSSHRAQLAHPKE